MPVRPIGRLGWVLLAGFASARAAGAAGIPLRLVVEDRSANELAVVVEVETTAEGGEPTVSEIEATVPGVVEIPSPRLTNGTIRVSADGWWSPPIKIAGDERPEALEARLWRATVLRGSIVVPRGTAPPSTLCVRVPSHAPRARPRLEPTDGDCPVDREGKFVCPLPWLAEADVRLRAHGFASRFFWDLDLSAAGSRDVGSLHLRPGASVVGQVEVPPPTDVRQVHLELQPVRRSPYSRTSEAERGASGLETHPDERRFFSFEGLAPGAYRLVAGHPRFATAELDPVCVVEGSQTELDGPLVLVPAEPLKLSVEPPFDPDQGDWRLKIYRSPIPDRRGPRPDGEAETAGGYGVVPGLAPGSYEVDVFDSAGRKMAAVRLTHTDGGEVHALRVGTVRVQGTVTLGEEPLVSRLRFRGRSTVDLETDDDGKFRGYLPEAGEWDVEVDAPVPPVRWRRRGVALRPKGGVAKLDLALPDTRLEAEVVTEDGRPQPRATVTATDSPWTGRPVTRSTDSEGKVVFYGLEEGTYQVEAAAEEELRSDTAAIDVREGTAPDLRVVLHPERIVRGRIVDLAGNALPGTWLELIPYTAAGWVDGLHAAGDSADAEGRFRMAVPAASPAVDLAVFAPGFAFRQVLLEVRDVGDLVVRPEGGTLVVDLPGSLPWADPSRPRPTLIGTRGQKVFLGALGGQWARLNGVVNDPASGRMTIPLLEPGSFRVCWTGPDDQPNPATPGAGCVAADVPAGGTLELHLGPSPGDQAAARSLKEAGSTPDGVESAPVVWSLPERERGLGERERRP